MAYRIEYTPELARRYPQTKERKRWKPGKMLLLVLVIIGALWIRFHGVPDFLIPGDAEITRAAASEFVDHVQIGMPVGEAVTVFCRQIIDGAAI